MGLFDGEPLILSALNVCCKSNWSADSPALAASTNIRHYFRVLYDEITFGDANGTLPCATFASTLRILGLKPPPNIPDISSLTDFERILTEQFCVQQNIQPRTAKSLSTEQMCHWLRQKSSRHPLPPLSLSPTDDVNKEQGADNVDKALLEHLVRLVSAQRQEIETLHLFMEDLTVAIQYLDAKNIASELNLFQSYASSSKMHKTERRQNRELTAENHRMQEKLRTISKDLEQLRLNLAEIKEKVDDNYKLCNEEKWNTKVSVCVANPDKSVADDSGWISDEEMISDAMTSSQSSANGMKDDIPLENHSKTVTFGLIGISERRDSHTERSPSPKGIKFTDRLILPSPWEALQIKTKLTNLSEKLTDAETKLNHVLKRREIIV